MVASYRDDAAAFLLWSLEINDSRAMLPPPCLKRPRAEVAELLQSQVEAGRAPLAETPRDETHFHELDEEHTRWTGVNFELLRRVFDNDTFAIMYNRHITYSTPYINPTYRDW